jgi:acetyl/propionyl-CoA carboxylase alpha subunit
MIKAAVNHKAFEIEWDSSSRKMKSQGKLLDWNSIQQNQLIHLSWNGKSFVCEWLGYQNEQRKAVVKVNGNEYTVNIEEPMDALLKSMGFSSSSQKKQRELKAPMPGLVLKVLVKPGEQIQKDTPLIILEAMKMENVIKAISDAEIKDVKIIEGQAVEKGVTMIEFC